MMDRVVMPNPNQKNSDTDLKGESMKKTLVGSAITGRPGRKGERKTDKTHLIMKPPWGG